MAVFTQFSATESRDGQEDHGPEDQEEDHGAQARGEEADVQEEAGGEEEDHDQEEDHGQEGPRPQDHREEAGDEEEDDDQEGPAAKKTTKKTAAASKKTTTKKTTTRKTIRKTGRSVAEVASAADADAKGYVFINGRRVRMISTKGKVPVRRTRTDRAAEETVAQEEATAKPIKTKLGRKELDYYRNLLLIKRAELVGDLTSLEAEALRSSGGNLSHMPIHMADIGSDTYEQDFMLGLAESERGRMREIDDALKRIAEKTYGICQMTGKPIPKARLEAKPWAKYTIEAARQLEQGWGT